MNHDDLGAGRAMAREDLHLRHFGLTSEPQPRLEQGAYASIPAFVSPELGRHPSHRRATDHVVRANALNGLSCVRSSRTVLSAPADRSSGKKVLLRWS